MFPAGFSPCSQGPATPSFSGDWRGGAAGHQAPQVGAERRAARPAPVVENDSEEEAGVKGSGTGKPSKERTVLHYNIYIYIHTRNI